ncbi:MAG: FAD-dependent oxidoreductase [Phycisphaerales bacterium]|nr:FAD-dependent oxidoreductase [Phycisphaerales bacterium]
MMPDLLPIPDLRDEQVLRRIAGIRPYRLGGIRLEADEQTLHGRLLVHNYGHGGAGITMAWGCAEDAATLVRQYAMRGVEVAVLGGGVIGLTTAHELADAGYRVTVYAQALPPNTTSNIAGALFLPAGVDWGANAAEQDVFIGRLRRSWARVEALIGEAPGVDLRTVYDVDATDNHHEDRWLEIGLPTEVRRVDELPLPGAPRSGKVYRSLFLETPQYLPWLLERAIARGVRFESKVFASLEDVRTLRQTVVVNGLGFGAGPVFGDSAMQGARGQLVLMKPQPLPYILQHGWTYMFPRRDAIILGGTFEPGVLSPLPDDVDCTRILSTHRSFFAPSLTEHHA